MSKETETKNTQETMSTAFPLCQDLEAVVQQYFAWRLSEDPGSDKWEQRVRRESQGMFGADGKLQQHIMANFRRNGLLLPDLDPSTVFAVWRPALWLEVLLERPLATAKDLLKELLSGSIRGGRALMKKIFQQVVDDGGLDLLQRYPAKDTPGRPYYIEYRGTSFNTRWLRHIYFLNLVRKHLGKALVEKEVFNVLDLGSGYGIFSYLLKSEYPQSRHILVDFPEQLITAHYFLTGLLPEAKIGLFLIPDHYGALAEAAASDRFDFILTTPDGYPHLGDMQVDLFSNFYSLSEMTREHFQGYLDHRLFRECRWLFTTNRFEAAPRFDPTHQGDITILDYPLDEFERIFFGVNAVHPYYIKDRKKFWYDKTPYSSQSFDFIGERKPAEARKPTKPSMD
jgi:putative sugar O-methyltransferase